MKRVIEINGSQYGEAKVKRPAAPMNRGGICAQCAFFKDVVACGDVLDRGESVFGGDCMERDVVYAKVGA